MVYMLDNVSTKRGLYIWFATIAFGLLGLYILTRYMTGTRLYALAYRFINNGLSDMTEDASINVRMNSIIRAFREVFENHLLPQGFGRRIGSGYGGFLCELGFFAIPVLVLISSAMSKTQSKRISRVVYFIVISVLLCNNTQIGNPLLLMTVGTNLYFEARR